MEHTDTAQHQKQNSPESSGTQTRLPQDASEAIPQLVRSHGDRIMGLALRLTRSRHEAEDLVQETFAQAFRKWGTFRGESDPGTWLYTIAVRLWRKKSRRSGRAPRSLTDLAPFKDATVADLTLARPSTIDDIPAKREAITAMEHAIASLPDEFRLAIVLKDILELDTTDVAAALGIKPQTVKTRVHRARLLLRAKLMTRVPQRKAPAPIYEKQVCFDLLRAKLDAMDAGRGFPIGQSVVCERCRAVFAELDLTQNVCAALSTGAISTPLQNRLRAIAASPAKAPPSRKPARSR
ncbi:MAG: RNA polymerase sigma factor [Phycisphaeraceae bacterium]|nr:RNA polymerase sigma factor [Phycisphaeraceae bacterium]MBX3365891.1 RNA polymerase sigma factor [Phycisphaeraceae bacterium]